MASGARSATVARAERLLQAGRSLVAELDVDVVLERLLETARELTGERYAAIGVLDEQRRRWSDSSPAVSTAKRARRSAIRLAAVACSEC